MKTILVPTDFSENGGNAFSYAAELAAGLHAKMILLHCSHVPVLASAIQLEQQTVSIVLNETTNRLKEFKNVWLQPAKEIEIEELAMLGLAVDMIILAADELKADLVVMGTKGASGLEEILLGSNTAAVMEKSPCSVLAIPEHAKFHGINKILFATDYRDRDIDSLNFLAGIASVFDATIMIVHISDVIRNDEYEKDLFDMFKERVLKEVHYKNLSFDLIPVIHVARALNSYALESQVDLIALSTSRRNLMTRLFDRSLTKKLAYHTHIPLLSLHV